MPPPSALQSQVHLTPRHIFSVRLRHDCVSSLETEQDIYISLYSPLLDLGRFLSFLILYTAARTPWTGDQAVARPLPTQRTTKSQNKRTEIHGLSGIGTPDPSVRAGETIHDLDCAATVIGGQDITGFINLYSH
jgi:hypothetical protein